MALAGLVLLAMTAHALVGSTWISGSDLWDGLLGQGDTTNIVWQLRLPRVMSCLLVGAILGAVGSAFQALFRNPLTDPYVIGVSSGAAVGGALALVFGIGASWTGIAEQLGPTLCATIGGFCTLALVGRIAGLRAKTDSNGLLLIGVSVGAFLSAVLSLVLLMAGQDTNQVLRWLLGSMTPAYWNRVELLGLLGVGGIAVLVAYSRPLNALAFGDDAAHRLGVSVSRVRGIVLFVGSILVAATVGAVGIIGFLGLVGPHIARRIVGVDWRWSLPASALCGAGLLTIADLLAQRVVANGEMPVGILTALLGAPWLLVLLRRA